jgi:uncharacterized protein involved in exopolysaccharide biosynthesis
VHATATAPVGDFDDHLQPRRGSSCGDFVLTLMAAGASQVDSVMAGGESDLAGLVRVLWRGRRLAMLVTLLFAAGGAAYALLSPKWYRAEVLLLPVSNDPTGGLLSQFGGLASLAGVKLGGSEDVEPLAVLKSRGFARSFIEDQGLMPVLLADELDSSGKQWKGAKEDWPDVRDAVKYFDKEVRRVVEDRKTGLITLVVEWKDPVVAAKWANLMAQKINAQMRERAIEEAKANVTFLKAELAANDLVAMQEPTGRVLELELQKLMLARSNTQFSFRVVDLAQVPKKPIRPQRVTILAVCVLLGGLVSALLLILIGALRAPESTADRV